MIVSSAERKPGDYITAGISASIIGHVVLAFFVFVKVFPNLGDLPEPVVYSISIESGKNIGAMSQVPKDDKPTEVAPLKNVAAPEEKSVEEKPEQPTDDKAIEPEDDSEVSTVETKPTPRPKPTAQPTAKPTAKPEPTKKPTTKKDQQTKKSDGETVDKRLQAGLQRYLGESSDAGGKGFGAASVGGKGMGGGVQRPPEFFIYEKIVRSRIKEMWRWHDTRTQLITQVAFEIEPDGRVKNVRVVKSSGDGGFDDSVVRAVSKASPLPPPPVSVYEQYFKSVRITFDPRE